MRKRALVLLIATMSLVACSGGPGEPSSTESTAELTALPHTARPKPDAVQAAFDAMTTDEKVGQLLMVPLDRKDKVTALDGLLRGGVTTGVLLLGNGWSKSQVAKVVSYIKQQTAGQPVGLYIAADQEGGKV